MPQDPQPKTELTLDEFREQARERYGIPKGLWESIRGQESGGDVNAVSPTGVRGEFQLTQATASGYGLDRNDPFHQIAGAAKNLREGYERYSNLKDDNQRWLAAAGYYYGGPDAVKSDGALSAKSKDGLSNPSAYVTTVAKRWKAYNDSQPATSPQAPGTAPSDGMRFDLSGQQAAKPTSTPSPAGTPGNPFPPTPKPLTPQETKASDAEVARRQRQSVLTGQIKAFEDLKRQGDLQRANQVAAYIKNRFGDLMEVGVGEGGWPYVKPKAGTGFAPASQAAATAPSAEEERQRAEYYSQPLYRQLGQEILSGAAEAGAGINRGVHRITDPLMRAVGQGEQVEAEQARGEEAARQLAREEAIANRMRSRVVRGTAAGAGQALTLAPAAALTGPAGVTALTALESDVEHDPAGALASTIAAPVAMAAGKALSPLAGRASARFASTPAQKAAQLAVEGATGAGLNAGQYAATSAALGRPITAEDVAEQAMTGAGLQMAMAPRISRAGAASGVDLGVPKAPAQAPGAKDVGIRQAIDRYTQTVDTINRSNVDPGTKAAQLAEARANFQAERAAARQASQAPVEQAAPPEAAPQAEISTLPPGVKILRQGEQIPPREKGQRQIPFDIEQPDGAVETVLVLAPDRIDGRRVNETMLRPMIEQALRPQSQPTAQPELSTVQPGAESLPPQPQPTASRVTPTSDPLFTRAQQTLSRGGMDINDRYASTYLQNRLGVGRSRADQIIKQLQASAASKLPAPTTDLTGRLRGAILAQPSSQELNPEPFGYVSPRKLLPPASTQMLPTESLTGFPNAPETAEMPPVQGPAQPTDQMPAIRERIAAENATTRTLPGQPQASQSPVRQTVEQRRTAQAAVAETLAQEPTNRIIEGAGAELPRGVSKPLEGQPIETPGARRPPTERLQVSKATDANIDSLRARRDALGRLAYDRRGNFTGDLRDEYNELQAAIRDYDNERAPKELAPPPGGRPEQIAPPPEERSARRAALEPRTGPMPETLAPGRKVTQEVQVPGGPKVAESHVSREDARQGHFERLSDEELVDEIRGLQEIKNQAIRGRSKLTPAQVEANNFDLKVAIDQQKERRRLQQQIGIEPANRIAPRTPGRAAKAAEAPPEGRQIQHSTLGLVTESANQKGVPRGKLRVIDAEGNDRTIQNPRARGGGNRQAAFVKSTGAIPAGAMPELTAPNAPRSPLAGKTVAAKAGPRASYAIPAEAMPELRGKAATPAELVRGMLKIKPSARGGAPVSISRLRAEFPNMSKADFDAAMVKLRDEGRIALHRHDYPQSLSEADRGDLVQDDKGNHYIAATFREGKGHVMGSGFGALQGLFSKRGAPKANPTKADIETEGLGSTIGKYAKGLGNEMRTLMTSFDFGAPGAQGFWLSASHPSKVPGSMSKMFRSLSQSQSDAIDTEIAFHPLRKLAEKSGVYFATGERLKGNKAGGEEAYRGFLAEKPGFRQLERGYRTYLDTLRMSVWESYVKSLDKAGITWENNPKAYKDAAAFINIASGRGQLRKGGMVEQASDLMGATIFAPRNLVANFQLLDPVRYARMEPAARKLALKDSLTTLGAMVGTAALLNAAGVKVGFNPLDDDFMQARAGNTRLDLTFGKKSQVQFVARLIAAAYNSARGEGNLPGKDALSVAQKFAEGKASPLLSDVLAFGRGRTFEGKSFKEMSTAEKVWEMAPVPMLLKDLTDAYREEGKTGAAKTSLSALGARINTYPDRAKPDFIETPPELRAEQKAAGMTRSVLEPKRGEEPAQAAPKPITQQLKDIFTYQGPKSLKKGEETPAQFAARRSLANEWNTKYGLELVRSEGYKAALPEVRKAALKYLNEQISKQSGEKRPALYLFNPARILESVRESERKERRKAAAAALQ